MMMKPLDTDLKKQTQELMDYYLDFTFMGLNDNVLNQLCIDEQENSKENDVE